METKEKSGVSSSNYSGCDCKCGCCQNDSMMHFGHGHRGMFVLRLLLGLLIIFLVFWIGFQIGEFKGYIESNYSGQPAHGRMMFYDTNGGNTMWSTDNGGYSPAWQGAPANSPTSSTDTTSTSTTSSTKKTK